MKTKDSLKISGCNLMVSKTWLVLSDTPVG